MLALVCIHICASVQACVCERASVCASRQVEERIALQAYQANVPAAVVRQQLAGELEGFGEFSDNRKVGARARPRSSSLPLVFSRSRVVVSNARAAGV